MPTEQPAPPPQSAPAEYTPPPRRPDGSEYIERGFPKTPRTPREEPLKK